MLLLLCLKMNSLKWSHHSGIHLQYSTVAAASGSDGIHNGLFWNLSVLLRTQWSTPLSLISVCFHCTWCLSAVLLMSGAPQMFRRAWAARIPPSNSAVLTWADINWVNAIDFGHLPFSEGEVSEKGKRQQHLCAAKRRRKKCVWER